MPAYSAAKAGVSALVRCLAVDYARYGIRVNAIVPGATETALMWDNVPHEDVAGMRETIHGEVPLGRQGDPQEPARAAVWLLSDEASYVTGSHLVCDGGILAKLSISVYPWWYVAPERHSRRWAAGTMGFGRSSRTHATRRWVSTQRQPYVA